MGVKIKHTFWVKGGNSEANVANALMNFGTNNDPWVSLVLGTDTWNKWVEI